MMPPIAEAESPPACGIPTSLSDNAPCGELPSRTPGVIADSKGSLRENQSEKLVSKVTF